MVAGMFAAMQWRNAILSVVWLTGAVCVSGADATPHEQEGIHEERFITIGGVEHWVTIHGASRNNPVLLIVHGGPGNPLSVLSETLYAGWEDAFTLVHYDQRGAGKTYGRNLPVEALSVALLEAHELTLELLVADGVEFSRYLRTYLEVDRLLLTGTSWGAALAVSIYQADPESFSAYVGLSQMVDFQINVAASYDLVRAWARERGDETALATLRSIGTPPWQDPRSAGRLRRIVRKYEQETTTTLTDLSWGDQYDTEEARAAYYAGEEFSWVKFVGMTGEGFANDLDLLSTGLQFDVPVVIIQGEGDLFTTADISKRYFDGIRAPAKEYVLVPDCGHDPNRAMLVEQFRILKTLAE